MDTENIDLYEMKDEDIIDTCKEILKEICTITQRCVDI